MLTVAAFLNCTPMLNSSYPSRKLPSTMSRMSCLCSTQYSLTSWAAMLSSCSARLFSGGAPNRSASAWATATSCSGRSSHRKGWREFFRRPVSEMSNTYRSRGFSRELSTRAMPLEPRRTYRRMVPFQRSYSAQAVASGRWAKIISCSWKGYLYSREAVVRNAVHLCQLSVRWVAV